MRSTVLKPVTIAQRIAASVFRTWSAKKVKMLARRVVLSAQRYAGFAPTRSRAAAPSPNRSASSARKFATGAPSNAKPMTWITVSAAPKPAAFVLRHAAKWPVEIHDYTLSTDPQPRTIGPT